MADQTYHTLTPREFKSLETYNPLHPLFFIYQAGIGPGRIRAEVVIAAPKDPCQDYVLATIVHIYDQGPEANFLKGQGIRAMRRELKKTIISAIKTSDS